MVGLKRKPRLGLTSLTMHDGTNRTHHLSPIGNETSFLEYRTSALKAHRSQVALDEVDGAEPQTVLEVLLLPAAKIGHDANLSTVL